jgi:hypothetical protein
MAAPALSMTQTPAAPAKSALAITSPTQATVTATNPYTQATNDYNSWLQNFTSQQEAQGFTAQQAAAMANPQTQSYNELVAAQAAATAKNNPWGINTGTNVQGASTATAIENADIAASKTGSIATTDPTSGIQYASYVPGWNSQDALAGKYQNFVDANSSGFNQEKSESESAAPTGWATAERLRQNQLSMEQRDAGAQQVGGQTAQADDALAAQGGLGSGARERVAEGGAKNYIGMEQGIDTSAINNDLQIGSTDESNKLSMLNNVAGQEQQRSANWMQANQYDEGQQTAEAGRLNAWNQMTTQQQNAAYAATQQANATADSGTSCCFIMLEARYGNGVMDEVVRKYRDEHLTPQNRRGYYKLAEVLVPIMRKYPITKLPVRILLTDPLVIYGKAYYGKNRVLETALRPVKNFWLGLFNLLGGECEFKRENGEYV